MPLYTLHRTHTHNSTLGVVSFIKNEETWVPPILEKEIVAIGGMPVSGTGPDVLGEEAEQKAAPLSFSERRDEIFAAFKLIVEGNESNDFTGAGVPTVAAVKKLFDGEVARNEIIELWGEFRVLADEAK